MTSEKAKTNKKWTSTEKYRNNYDKIFGKNKEYTVMSSAPMECFYCSCKLSEKKRSLHNSSLCNWCYRETTDARHCRICDEKLSPNEENYCQSCEDMDSY